MGFFFFQTLNFNQKEKRKVKKNEHQSSCFVYSLVFKGMIRDSVWGFFLVLKKIRKGKRERLAGINILVFRPNI